VRYGPPSPTACARIMGLSPKTVMFA
jgi:hypothetical protein